MIFISWQVRGERGGADSTLVLNAPKSFRDNKFIFYSLPEMVNKVLNRFGRFRYTNPILVIIVTRQIKANGFFLQKVALHCC